MKNKSIYIITIFSLFSCISNRYSKENHSNTWIIEKGLYVESFQTYQGGATTSNSYSFYITDSIHFRKFIGEENYDDQNIIWKKTNNIVNVYMVYTVYNFDTYSIRNDERIVRNNKLNDSTYNTITYDTIQIGKHSLKQLINEGKFE